MILMSVCVADRHRPYLMTRVQGTSDYINAVFVDVCIGSFLCITYDYSFDRLWYGDGVGNDIEENS